MTGRTFAKLPGNPWAASLRRRLANRESWAAYLLLYGAFSGYAIWGFSQRPGWLAHPQIWSMALLSPWGWLGGMFWLSPLPWQWRLSGPRPSFARGLFQSLLFSEAWLSIFVFWDVMLYRQVGVPVEVAPLLVYNLIIPGSVMVAAGYALDRRDHVEQQHREARDRLLQSQLHPHVLFNSLNGLAELIVKDPVLAEESVRSLSDLMRRLLSAGAHATIPLREERALMEDYLALETLRLGPRLRLRWEWDGGLQGVEILPLLMQPLVENAIKHGLAPLREGGDLVIATRAMDGELRLEVRNTGKGLDIPASTSGLGVGLQNLESRLELAYGAKALFTLTTEAAWTVARIRIAGLRLPL